MWRGPPCFTATWRSKSFLEGACDSKLFLFNIFRLFRASEMVRGTAVIYACRPGRLSVCELYTLSPTSMHQGNTPPSSFMLIELIKARNYFILNTAF